MVKTLKILSVSDLHGRKKWINWVLTNARTYDAIILPGDLVNGWDEDLDQEWDKALRFLRAVQEVPVPVILCSGNHDEGLIPYLKDKDLSLVFWDGQVLDINGLRIRSIGSEKYFPDKNTGDQVWIHHEPPSCTPISTSRMSLESLGSDELKSLVNFEPELLPPLVIGGHQHRPESWHWATGQTLFLNSGQISKSSTPDHIVLEFDKTNVVATHNKRKLSINHILKPIS